MENSTNDKKRIYIYIGIITLLIIAILGVSFAYFNYTRTGDTNTIKTGTIIFDYTGGSSITIENESPISEAEATTGNDHKISFSITAHNELENGMRYNVYAVYGDEEAEKNRLLDSIIALKFIPPTDGNGFTTTTNNFATAGNLSFTNGKALLSTGIIKNTTGETTKNYDVYVWIDESKVFVSSTTKRQTLAEGNPSLADTTAGVVTANRYVKNDTTLTETSLYPALEDAEGKIIYTTNEYKNAYCSIKIAVEAEDILN